MQIIQRLTRILKADIHGLMDQFENKELLLKQYLRDMSVALLEHEDRQKILSQSRNAAAQKLASTNSEIEKLEQDLEAALKRNKDNIARNLIRRLKSITDLQSYMRHHIDKLDHEMAQFQTSIHQRRIQFEQLKMGAAKFMDQSQKDKLNPVLPDFGATHFSQEVSDEDVEIALKQRKETIYQKQGGATA